MAGLSRLQRDTIREILRQLRAARSRILAAIVDAPNDAAWGRLAWQRAEITRAIRAFQQVATATTVEAARKAFEEGIASIERPFANAGVALPPLAPRIDHRVLLAMEDFLTDRISDISTAAVNKINTALAQHILGVDSMADTITNIQRILGGETRRRAMTIAYTEVGRAMASAQYQAMLAQARYVPGLKKRWRHSAKLHPRPSHVAAAHDEPIPVAEPFRIVSDKTGEVELLRFPRDPLASIGNTINCGCSMIPVLPSVDELFDGPIGPIVPAGTVVRDGVPVAADGGAPPAVPPPAPPAPPGGGGDEPITPSSIIEKLAGLVAAAGDAQGRWLLRSLWTNLDSYGQHVNRRILRGDVADAAELARRTFEALAAARFAEIALPTATRYAVSEFRVTPDGWLVLLNSDGRIITSYPYEPGHRSFADFNQGYGHRIQLHELTAADRERLARLFAGR